VEEDVCLDSRGRERRWQWQLEPLVLRDWGEPLRLSVAIYPDMEELVGFLPALVPKPMRSLGREREKELRPIEDAYQQGESKSIHQPDHHNTKHYDSRHSP
jgi:hypothetical protein